MKLQFFVLMFVYTVFNPSIRAMEVTTHFYDIAKTEAADIFTKHSVHHIAIIADGNRRWAKNEGLTQKEGHFIGIMKVIPEITRKAFENGLSTLTFWWFSTENWNREPDEVEP